MHHLSKFKRKKLKQLNETNNFTNINVKYSSTNDKDCEMDLHSGEVALLGYQLKKMDLPIRNYQNICNTRNASLVEVEQSTNELIKNLKNLQNSEMYTTKKHSITTQLVSIDFLEKLSTVQCNNKQLFDLIDFFIQNLIECLKRRSIENKDENEPDQYEENNKLNLLIYSSFEIFNNYLNNFTIYKNLKDYQIPYLNKLITEILKIYYNNIKLFNQWFLENGINHKVENTNNLHYIILNLLYNDFKICGYKNYLEFIKLSNNSNAVCEYLIDKIKLYEYLVELYFKSLFPKKEEEKEPNNDEELLKTIILTLECSCEKVRNAYFTIYEKKYDFDKMNECNFWNEFDDFILSALKIMDQYHTTKVMDEFFDNDLFFQYSTKKFQLYSKGNTEHYKSIKCLKNKGTKFNYFVDEKFILYLDYLIMYLKNQTHSFTFLFGDENQENNEPNEESNKLLRTQIMSIENSNTKDIVSNFMHILNNYSGYIESYTFKPKEIISNNYSKMLLQFFQNDPKLNSKLMELSLVIFLKFNLLNSSEFMKIINFLYEAHLTYFEQLKKYQKFEYDEIEINKIKSSKCEVKSSEILNDYELNEVPEIDYDILPLNLSLFPQLLINFYVSTKLKRK
ncbi:hypothetical protein KGF54_003822 [Candida jiufengensis]|uniref:uncharacterized protein n=1 Tax=Candida jiufengensis TaxID=497108 RepID=UPI0022245F78|nr:uncharacterized protein KGF54_003822 [Candida jiufengensis]KAI5950748.1 hypothetical protein KGF54_003822 [Candida jiufengensis]